MNISGLNIFLPYWTCREHNNLIILPRTKNVKMLTVAVEKIEIIPALLSGRIEKDALTFSL